MKKIDLLINIVVPVICGTLIYVINTRTKVNELLRNQVPDAIWAYALTSSVLIIWNRKINLFWLLMIFLLYISFELLQYFHLVDGTADWMDILAYFCATIIALLINPLYKSVLYE